MNFSPSNLSSAAMAFAAMANSAAVNLHPPSALSSLESLNSLAALRPKTSEVACLPKGWLREELPATGHVVYYSPKGQVVRSKSEMARILGDHYDLTAFDFNSGKINPALLRHPVANHKASSSSNNRKSNKPSQNEGYKNQNKNSSSSVPVVRSTASVVDSSLVTPIRQTASIFKQPVTVVKQRIPEKGSEKSAAPTRVQESKNGGGGSGDRPRQVFWQRRLSGLRASYADEDSEGFQLPLNFECVGPGVDDNVVLASIATALHLTTGAISGQNQAQMMRDRDASVFINPDQPLMASVKVSQTDIEKQEERVAQTRKQLADALAALTQA